MIDIMLHLPFDWRDVGFFAAGFLAFPLLLMMFAIGFNGDL